MQAAGAEVIVSGEEARHAVRVKRVGEGEQVQLLDGAGGIADATVLGSQRGSRGDWLLRLRIAAARTVERQSPRLEVWTALPKGPRAAELVDGLSQAGADHWRPLRSERSVGRPSENLMERLSRVAAEASKQCGRAWLLEIGPESSFADALSTPTVIVADASGPPFKPTGAPALRVLVGPEGGWTPQELRAAAASGAVIARFGPHTMRVETAAVAAAAVVLAAEARPAPPPA